MGQKVNPVGFRLLISKDWNSKWYSSKASSYSSNLIADITIKRTIDNNYKKFGISKVCIERYPNELCLRIFTSKPGLLIGNKGAMISSIRDTVIKILHSLSSTCKKVSVKISEVAKPDIDSSLVASLIAKRLQNREPFKRVVKKCMQVAMNKGAKGIKISCSGRLGGVEIARTEVYRDGSMPLHTLRSNIDYAIANSYTIYGVIGIKVWIYK